MQLTAYFRTTQGATFFPASGMMKQEEKKIQEKLIKMIKRMKPVLSGRLFV